MKDQQRNSECRNEGLRGNEKDQLRHSSTSEQRTSSDRDVRREDTRQGTGRGADLESEAKRDQKSGSTISTGNQVAGGSRGESINTSTGSGLKTKSSVTGSDTDGQI